MTNEAQYDIDGPSKVNLYEYLKPEAYLPDISQETSPSIREKIDSLKEK